MCFLFLYAFNALLTCALSFVCTLLLFLIFLCFVFYLLIILCFSLFRYDVCVYVACFLFLHLWLFNSCSAVPFAVFLLICCLFAFVAVVLLHGRDLLCVFVIALAAACALTMMANFGVGDNGGLCYGVLDLVVM